MKLLRAMGLALLATATTAAPSSQPKALVYRGPAACNGCPEAVAKLLSSSPSNFTVTYVGPHEKTDITQKTLSQADVYAQPGGGNIKETWPKMKPYNHLIRNFVADGGRYMGFCLGAYFAGTPGFNMLPKHDQTYAEISQPGAQVQNGSNTIIQVDWHFTEGSQAGTNATRWMFFQDGPVMKLPNLTETSIVLGRYASDQNIAASITPFGKGWVGVTGPHPEADESWYKPYHLHNPDGISYEIGYDFVEAVFKWTG